MIPLTMPDRVIQEHTSFIPEIENRIDGILDLIDLLNGCRSKTIQTSRLVHRSSIVGILFKKKGDPFKSQRIDKSLLCLKGDEADFFKEVRRDIKYILLSKPDELLAYNTQLKQRHKCYDSATTGAPSNSLRKLIEYSFDYTSFYESTSARAWNAYEYCKHLGLKACPYCNRVYIGTMYGPRKWRAELDHYFPKSKYPILRLSIFNLVPACPLCNATKTAIDFPDAGLNPFSQKYPVKFVTKATVKSYTGYSKHIDIELVNSDGSQVWGVVKSFYEQIGVTYSYQDHGDEAAEIINLYLDLQSNDALLNQFKIPKQMLRQLLLRDDLSLDSPKRRPLSKLRYDIAEQAGLLPHFNRL